MKRIFLSCILWTAAMGAFALDFSLSDGSKITGDIQEPIELQTAFGTLRIEGAAVEAITIGEKTRVFLTGGDIATGVMKNVSLKVKWKYGITDIAVSKIKTVSKEGTVPATAGTVQGGGAAATSGPAITIGSVEFVEIPAGDFSMGDSSGGGKNDERPVHKVTLDSFYMAKYEVTLKQWKEFIVDSAYRAQGQWQGKGEDYPVTDVSWEDANAWCTWFTRKYAVNVRLPTEAEWEYAARGGQAGKKYPNGDTVSRLDANYESDGPAIVGKYPPNSYGLFDMAGNVWEWCNDWYGDTYYQSSPSRNPTGPAAGSLRVGRGGGWRNVALRLRCAYRGYEAPGGSYDGPLGFRPVRTR